MERALITVIFLITLTSLVPAQTPDTFDIASFKVPAGWEKQAKDGGVIYTTSDRKTNSYAMIFLYRSDKSSANPRADFDADWARFVESAYGVKSKPEIEPQKQADKWTVISGGASFESDLGTSAVILSTYSGFGTKFSAAAIFNSQQYIAAIDAFATSIKLAKRGPSAPAVPASTSVDTTILGTWGKNVGARMTYGDPVAAGMAGYSKDQYTFSADGTYSYVSKTFRMAYDKILLVIESGKYSTTGTTIVIDPHKSVIQRHGAS